MIFCLIWFYFNVTSQAAYHTRIPFIRRRIRPRYRDWKRSGLVLLIPIYIIMKHLMKYIFFISVVITTFRLKSYEQNVN